MKYRIGTHQDHADIEDCIASTEYYGTIDVSLMDGTFIVAENKDGQIVGCVWTMHYGRNAYVDLLAVRPGYQNLGVGIKLLVRLRQVLKRRGVRFVRSAVHLSNVRALRVGKALGAMTHSPYALFYVDLGAK